MAESEKYTRYYGVVCANEGCRKFIRLGDYQTPYPRAGVEVRLSKEIGCPHCRALRMYTDLDVLFSETADGTALFGRYQS